MSLIKDLKSKGYMTVGITGHRDLLVSKKTEYKQQIKQSLEFLQNSVKKPLMIISPLADGADRLMVEVASELNLLYSVLLPMQKRLYVKDFDDSSHREFQAMIEDAYAVDEVELYYGNTEESILEYGTDRDFQYWLLGKVLAEECDELIAVWKEDEPIKIGGTSHVVHMRRDVFEKPLQIIAINERSGIL